MTQKKALLTKVGKLRCRDRINKRLQISAESGIQGYLSFGDLLIPLSAGNREPDNLSNNDSNIHHINTDKYCELSELGLKHSNISISLGIPIASPFCKGGLRGIFLIQPGLFENLLKHRGKS